MTGQVFKIENFQGTTIHRKDRIDVDIESIFASMSNDCPDSRIIQSVVFGDLE